MSKRPSPALIVAAIAMTFALVGTSVAADPVAKLNKSKVKKIARKQAQKEISKAAPTLSVRHALEAEHAKTANTATTATTATNANALGGKPLNQVVPVSAFAESNAGLALTGAAQTVVSTNIALTTASRVNVITAAELNGADSNEVATCFVDIDGTTASGSFQTSFDDIGTVNPASITVIGSRANVPAGNHTATMECLEAVGTITKENASISVTAVPNP